MPLGGKKLGILLSTGAADPAFRSGVRLAEAAVRQGVIVYLYCIDEAVTALADAQLQALKSCGVNLFACAYGAQRRNITLMDQAAFAGLSVVSDLMTSTDRFLSFN